MSIYGIMLYIFNYITGTEDVYGIYSSGMYSSGIDRGYLGYRQYGCRTFRKCISGIDSMDV